MFCILVALSVAFAAVADDEPGTASAPGAPRHRIDFGVQWFDAAEGKILTGSVDYSWVPLDHHGFTVTVPLVAALGLGLAETVPGRNPLIDGFGLIAFASLFPIMSVMAYAQLSEWRANRADSQKRGT